MTRRGEDDNAEFLQEYVKLMTDHQWPLRGFILSLMPGSPDVGDVLQETNLVLWQKRRQFKLGTNFFAWACRIARYEVMHHRDQALIVSSSGSREAWRPEWNLRSLVAKFSSSVPR